jgi:catechol 2,3-dioxygenase-like lactoylglutathione lyase family enzyme
MTKAKEAKETTTPEFTSAFSSFSVDDIEQAKTFYGETLGLDVDEQSMGLQLELPDDQKVFIYPKSDHKAATFTVLNLVVEDIAEAVETLKANGIKFESYSGEMKTDENGIMWGKDHDGGPNIAWFRDPAGNFVSVIEQ